MRDFSPDPDDAREASLRRAHAAIASADARLVQPWRPSGDAWLPPEPDPARAPDPAPKPAAAAPRKAAPPSWRAYVHAIIREALDRMIEGTALAFGDLKADMQRGLDERSAAITAEAVRAQIRESALEARIAELEARLVVAEAKGRGGSFPRRWLGAVGGTAPAASEAPK